MPEPVPLRDRHPETFMLRVINDVRLADELDRGGGDRRVLPALGELMAGLPVKGLRLVQLGLLGVREVAPKPLARHLDAAAQLGVVFTSTKASIADAAKRQKLGYAPELLRRSRAETWQTRGAISGPRKAGLAGTRDWGRRQSLRTCRTQVQVLHFGRDSSLSPA